MLEKGTKAPDFELPNQLGERVRLYDLLEKGPVVLYFYPKDETSGCTAQACAFRDNYQQFKDAGAEVVGVSTDSATSHQAFAENHSLPFVLLSDSDKKVRQLYRVPNALLVLPGRVTFVIGKDQKILHTFNSMWKPAQHIQEALGVL